jgi:hypothetical protein
MITPYGLPLLPPSGLDRSIGSGDMELNKGTYGASELPTIIAAEKSGVVSGVAIFVSRLMCPKLTVCPALKNSRAVDNA